MSADKPYRATVIIVSDRAFSGERADRSAPVICEKLTATAFKVEQVRIVPDDCEPIRLALKAAVEGGSDLVLTSGGTGLSPRDVTPEATRTVIERDAPGIAEAIRAYSMTITKRAMLSRGIAGITGRSLIINLPGSPKAVGESLDAIIGELEHAMLMLAGGDH